MNILGPESVIWDQISEIWPQKGQPGNPDGLRRNKTIESFSSSHSSKLQCMLLESSDVLFLSLKDRIPSGREYCIEPSKYRKINFHQYHLDIQ